MTPVIFWRYELGEIDRVCAEIPSARTRLSLLRRHVSGARVDQPVLRVRGTHLANFADRTRTDQVPARRSGTGLGEADHGEAVRRRGGGVNASFFKGVCERLRTVRAARLKRADGSRMSRRSAMSITSMASRAMAARQSVWSAPAPFPRRCLRQCIASQSRVISGRAGRS
jgi:hypothetical protein